MATADTSGLIFDYWSDCVFIVDVALSFMTTYKEDGVYVNDRYDANGEPLKFCRCIYAYAFVLAHLTGDVRIRMMIIAAELIRITVL